MPSQTRTVLVTGASKGIGLACARRLAGRGYRVFAGCRAEEDADGLWSYGVTPVRLDVTESDQIAATAAVIEEATGEAGLHGLVNNAGIAVAGPLEFLPVADFRRQLEINVVGQVAVTQAVLPALRRANGRVVFIGSISGRSALPFTGAYAASKFGLEAVTDALRVELLPWNIRVALVEPGVIATPIWETSLAFGEELLAAMPAQALEYYGHTVDGLRDRALRGKKGRDPDAVARVVEHALTGKRPRLRYIVGADARLRLLLERLPTRMRDRIVAEVIKRL